MPDGLIEFQTNIGSVAAQIEQGMARMNRALRQAQTQIGGAAGTGAGPTANLEAQIIGGVQQRLNNVGLALDKSLYNLSRSMEKRIRGGERVNVGTEVRKLVNGTNKQLVALATDVSRGLPAGLQSMQPQLQSVMNNGASEILRSTEKIYANLATQMRTLAAQVGTKGVLTPGRPAMQQGQLSGVIGGNQPLMRRMERAVLIPARGADVTRAQRDAALGGILGKSGFGLDRTGVDKAREDIARQEMTAARERQARVKKAANEQLTAKREQAILARQQVKDEREHAAAIRVAAHAHLRAQREQAIAAQQEAEALKRQALMAHRTATRVFNQAKRNLGARAGEPADPKGARFESGTGYWYDKGGQAYQPTKTGGLEPVQTQLEGNVGESRRAAMRAAQARVRDPDTFDIKQGQKELLAMQRDDVLMDRRRQADLHASRKQLIATNRDSAAKTARATERRLAREISAGTATRLGGSSIVRDRTGAYYDVNKQGARPLSPQSAYLQRAIRQNEEQLARQADVAARRNARLNEVRSQRAVAPLPKRSGLQGGFDTAFGGGGRGLRGGDIANTAMSFSRYMISAAAFAAVAKGFAEIKAAVLDYRDSLTDLNVALGRSGAASGGFLDTLSETSRLVGENPGEALDAAARGVRAFGSAMDEASKEEFGAQFAGGVAQLAVIADKSMKDASGDIIAIANNFSIAGDNIQRVNDAIAASKINVGGDPKEIAQGLASLGSAAEAAGFSLEQTSDMIALVQSRTDQTGRAVATRLARVFSIVGGSAGQGAIAKLNQSLVPEEQVNTNATVANQLRQLGAVYNDLSESQKAQLRSALGGTANTKELIPLLQEQDLLQDALGKSYREAGEGLDEFNRKSRDLRGTVTKITGDIQRLVVELTEAGAWDIFGFAVQAIEPFLNQLVQLLEVYNRLPAPMKSILALTLQLAAAQKLYSMYLSARTRGLGVGHGVVGGQVAAAGGASMSASRRYALREPRALSRLNRGGQVFYGPVSPRQVQESTMRGRRMAFGAAPMSQAFAGRGPTFPRARGFAVRVAAQRELTQLAGGPRAQGGNLRQFGRAVTTVGKESLAASDRLGRLSTGFRGMVNSIDPLLLAIGGAMAVVSAYNASVRTVAAAEEGQALTGQAVGAGELRDEIARRQTQIETSKEARRGIFGGLADRLNSRQAETAEQDLQREVDRLVEAGEAIDKAKEEAAKKRTVSDVAAAIDVTVEGGITQGLELLTNSGRDATTQLSALHEAMDALTDKAARAEGVLTAAQQIEFRQLASPNILTGFAERAELAHGRRGMFDAWATTSDEERERDFFRNLGADLEGEGQDAIDALIAEYLEGSGGELDLEGREELVQLVLRQIAEYGDIGEEGSQYNEWVEGEIRMALKNTQDGLIAVENIALLWNEFLTESAKLAQAAGAKAGILAQLGEGGREGATVAAATAEVAERRKAVAKARATRQLPDETQHVSEEELEQILLDLKAAELAVIDALMARADTLASIAASDLPATDAIGRLQTQIDAIKSKRRITRDPEKIASLGAELAEQERALATARIAQANAELAAGFDSRDAVGTAYVAAMAAYNELLAIFEDEDTNSAAYFEAKKKYADALIAYHEAEMARTHAYRQAITDPRDTLANIDNEISNLLSQYEHAPAGSQMQHELTRQINEAYQKRAEETVATANAATLAGVDPASGLQAAAAALTNANRDLSLTKQGTKEWYAALGAVNEAMVGLTDAHLAAAHVSRQLAIDLTDPVANAEEALRQAQDALNAAIARGAPTDVTEALRVEEKNAQASAEAAAFDQRLSDVQVAEQLGRISHQAYIRYLEGESARLSAITDRTRQQQDQLDQVDLLLKSAAETASGLWNIGDIRMPTPYEVRRAITAQAEGMTLGESFRATQSVSATRVTNDNRVAYITINGADTEQVRIMLEQQFGPTTVQRSSTGVAGGRN